MIPLPYLASANRQYLTLHFTSFQPPKPVTTRILIIGPFTISKSQNQEISEFYVVHKRRATDSKALKL